MSDPHQPSPQIKAQRTFSFRRSRGRGAKKRLEQHIYLDYANGSECIHSLYGDRETARAWARKYAADRGMPYVETPPRQDPTPEQLLSGARRAFNYSIQQTDQEAEAMATGAKHVDWRPPKKDLQEAARLWMRGATSCIEAISLWPEYQRSLREAAAERVDYAIGCLESLKEEYMTGLPTLKVHDGEGHTPPSASPALPPARPRLVLAPLPEEPGEN